jgi:hypothetical protein
MPLAYNSTILKKKMDLACGHYDFNFSKGRCKACAALDRKPIKKMSDKRMELLQDEDLQELIEDCDAVFSKYVRIRDADKNGIVSCYTCGCQKRWQDMQCSHFIGRTSLMTRWEPLNAKAACVGCNCLAHGKLDVFEQKLNEENAGIVEWLREQGNIVYKPSRSDLKELLVELRCKLRTVQTKLILH